MPKYLAEAAARTDARALREWMARVSEVIQGVAERWDLRLGDPYEPGGQCSWVAPVLNACGEHLVLKVGWRHPEAAHEADALRSWAGAGAVELRAAETFDQTSVLLLERCVPGTPLGHSMPEPDQDLVLARLLPRLWTALPQSGPFRQLQVMCEQQASEFEQDRATAEEHLDPGLLRAGMALLRELPQTAERSVLLYTDLHAQNILAAQREPWLAIDPKPYVGDPAYDVIQHMLNCLGRLESDPIGLCQRLAGLLDLDAERVRQWLFSRCVQESTHRPLLHDIAIRIAP